MLVVQPTTDGASVDVLYETSNGRLDTWCDKHGVPDVVIATGFIARNPEG